MNKTLQWIAFGLLILVALVIVTVEEVTVSSFPSTLRDDSGLISRDSCIGVVNALVDDAVKDALNENAQQTWNDVELPSVKKRIADGVRELPDDGEIHYERM